MAYVITEPCIDVRDQSCVEVCPVDCIHFEEGKDRLLYVDPVECIDCGACVPACPEDAIFEESDVPEEQQRFTEINALWFQDPEAARAQIGGAPAPVAEGAPAEAAEAPAGAEAPAEAAAVAPDPTPQAAAAATALRIAAPAPHASKQDFSKAFAGLLFPTSRDAIVSRARDSGGLDREVSRILERLPARRYGSLEELEEMVRAIYSFSGVPEDALPL